MDKRGGSLRVAITPLTTKTDTDSDSKNNDRSSQKSTVALPWKSTKSNVTMSGDFPSLLSLSPEFNDLHIANLNRIYSPHGETNLTFLLLKTKDCLECIEGHIQPGTFLCVFFISLLPLAATSQGKTRVNHNYFWNRKYHLKI